MVSLMRSVVLSLILLAPAAAFSQDSCEGVVIRQSTSPRARPGDEQIYRIAVHHSGSCLITGLEMIDYLPQDAEWVGADPTPDEWPGKARDRSDPWPVNRLRWEGRILAPNESIEISIIARVPEMKTGWMRNTFCVRASNLSRRCADIETFVRRD
jgi:hypothetical protein